MASLINFKGSTGVELIGIVLNHSGSYLPSTGMIALLQVAWEIPAQLENFISGQAGNDTVQLLTVRPAPGQAVLSYAVVPASSGNFPGGSLPIIAIGGSSKPSITVTINMQGGGTAGFTLVNAVPIGQEIEMSAQGGQQGAPPFTAVANIIYIFDEIQPL